MNGNVLMKNLDTILYISYGSGAHVHETLFSILTLPRYQVGVMNEARVCVLTDEPRVFQGRGIEALEIPRATLDEWKGPHGLGHRCKILAIRHVLERYGGRCLYVDGDTYFIRPPGRALGRIDPGRSVMHRVEGYLGLSRHHHRIGELLKALPGGLAGGPSSLQWNAGVVGIHARDLSLLDDVLRLTDALLDGFYAPVMEQVAFSLILAEKSRLRPARDIIYHYCVSPDRERFRVQLPGLIAASEGMTVERRAAWLYARRTRPTWDIKARVLAKDFLNATGLLPVRDRFDCI
jgi:hypothetical protein